MDLASAQFLCSPAGQDALLAARDLRQVPAHRRAAAMKGLGSGEQLRLALGADDLRQRAAARCPHAEQLLFTAEALEQATAWQVAEERAGRWQAPLDVPLSDLCAGIGLDALATAQSGRPVVAYERDPARALLLAYNARALGLEHRIEVRAEDSVLAAPAGDLAYFDPARRQAGARTRDPEAFAPPLETWAALLARFERAMVKLPPILHDDPLPDRPIEVVSLRGRARERRVFVGDFEEQPMRRALALPGGAHVEGEGQRWPAARDVVVGDWLLDPDVSVVLSGLVGDLARRDGLHPIHPRLAYLIGSEANEQAPGHWMRVDALLPTKRGPLDAWLAAHEIGRLTLRKRGIDERVETWRKRLHPKGENAGTLVFTRDLRDRWVVYGCFEA